MLIKIVKLVTLFLAAVLFFNVKNSEASNRTPAGVCISFYLEDPILGMPRTPEDRANTQAQNKKTQSLYEALDPKLVKDIKDRAVELTPKNAPARSNFFGDEYGVKDGSLHRFKADGTVELFIPGSVLPKDAGFGPIRISPDQTKVAFAYLKFGSDWQTWQVYDLVTKQLLEVDGSFTFKGFGGQGISWTLDSRSILIPKDASIEKDFVGQRNPTILLHTIGKSQESDRVLFADKEPSHSSRWSAITIDESTALVYRVQGVATIPMAAYAVDLKTGAKRRVLEPNKYLGSSPGNGIVGVHSGIAYIRTAQVGNNFGIVAVDVKEKRLSSASKTIIANDPNSVLYQASIVGDKIVTQNTNRDLSVEFRMYELNGKLVATWKPQEEGLPNWGHPSLPLMDADKTSHAGNFTYSSVDLPPVTVKADVKAKRFIRQNNVAEISFDPKKVVRELVTYKSHDGKDIQMFIYRRADMEGTAAKFAYLYSYGFIGIPNLPQWNRKFQLALELGGVVAIPAIRGGGEFGVESQLAGTNERENTFQDLVYASRWLKSNINIEGKRVAVVGRSFGGLTGAVHFVHNQNEFDLISAIVPVTDWQKHFRGAGWWMGDDFGVYRNPISGYASKRSMKRLEKQVAPWDPANHLYKLDGKKLIPAIFFSEQYDTNTTPHQTLNFVQAAQARFPDQPIYMFEHPNGGHGSRLELVDEFLFIASQFGLTELRPLK